MLREDEDGSGAEQVKHSDAMVDGDPKKRDEVVMSECLKNS